MIRINLNISKQGSKIHSKHGEGAQQAAIEELKKQFPNLHLFDPINTVSTPSPSYSTESNLSSTDSSDSLFITDSTSTPEPSPPGVKKANNKSLPIITLDTLTNGDLATLKDYLTQGGDPNITLVFSRPLIMQVFILATNLTDDSQSQQIKNNQIAQLYLLSRHTRLDVIDISSKQIIDHLKKNMKKSIELLDNLHQILFAEALTLSQYLINEINQISEILEKYLVTNGLESAPLPTSNKNSSISNILDNSIWKLCSGFISEDKPNQYDPIHIVNMSQALLSISDPGEIIAAVGSLWDQFGLRQRFIATFLVKELLISDIHHLRIEQLQFFAELKTFIDVHLNKMPVHGVSLKICLEAILAIERRFNQNICLQNYQIIENWLSKPEYTPSLKSLDELLKKSLQGTTEQQQIADIMTKELNMSMLAVYKRLHVSEIYNKAWIGPKKKFRAPNILTMTSTINNITAFIQYTILKANTAIHARQYISLFILIAHNLCRSRNELSPDLCTAHAIVMALNSGPVSRLKQYFDNLPEQIRMIFNELDQLFSPIHNNKWLRLMMVADLSALPYIGLLQKDLTFIHDGNSGFDNSGIQLGTVFNDMIKRQRKFLMIPCVFTTNLTQKLSEMALITEKELDDLSYKHTAPKWSIVGLSFEVIYEKLTNYLDNDVIPIIMTDDNMYFANEAIKPLLEHLSTCLYKNSNPNNRNIRLARGLLERLIGAIRQHNPLLQMHYSSYYYYCRLPLVNAIDAPAAAEIPVTITAPTTPFSFN